MVNFLIVQNKCISHQFSKKAHIHQKITIDQLVFSVFSKIFERLLNRQLLEFFDDIISKFQCAFILERVMELNSNIECTNDA